MSDLISRKALLKVLKDHEQEWNNTYYIGLGLRIAISEVEEQPAAEPVEVVRCKDCEKRHTEECAMQYECDCGSQCHWENNNDYCSWGVKRDTEKQDDICKTTNLPCIRCNPGPCDHREVKK